MSKSINWNYFLGGYNYDGEDYSGHYPISTWGCFYNGNEARYGSGFHSAVFGIPYNQELQEIDRLHFEMELANAESSEQRTAIQGVHINQIWWRHLEAKPIWTRLPTFIYAWAYASLSEIFSGNR